MRTILKFIIARAAEPTTWRGAVYLITAAGLQLAPELQAAIITVGIATAGLLAVVLPEPSAAGPTEGE